MTKINFFLLLLLVIFSLTISLTEAQTNYFINWGAPQKQLIGSNERFVLHFEDATYEDETGLPYHLIFLENTDLSSAEIIGATYQPLDDFEAKLVRKNTQFVAPEVSVITSIDHFTKSTFVKILPFKSTPSGELQKLISFNLKLTHNKNTKARQAAKVQQKTTSALANGIWYKIQLTEDGIHKIDKRFLEAIGIKTNSIDPRNIRIFGNGGGMLPQLNKAPRYDGLQENAILVVGEEDGAFNKDDYILFYGKSQTAISFDKTTEKLTLTKNIYSDASYYFINIADTRGKRIQSVSNNASPEITVDYYDDMLFHERDDISYIKSGRDWVGEEFTNSKKTYAFSFNITHAYPASTLAVTSTFHNTNKQVNTIETNLNNIKKQTLTIGSADNKEYGLKANTGKNTLLIDQVNGQNTLNVTHSLTSLGKDLSVYLDKIHVHLKRKLQPYTSQTLFQTIESINHTDVGYTISNVSPSYSVYDITEPTNVKNISYNLSGSTISFTQSSDELSRFLLFDQTSSFPSPTFVEETTNQNLRGDISAVPTLLIITSPFLEEKAKEYAQMKRETVNMDVLVRTTNTIYNEFSSGAQDITALRDYIRMLYLADPYKFSYVLLFGDASYDYKNRIQNNTNFVPNYQSEESFNNVDTYCSDDYYGFMDDDEGEWTSSLSHMLDIGVGRFPITTLEEADAVIKKVRLYTTSKEAVGKWRNQIVLVADDDDVAVHMQQADTLTKIIKENSLIYDINKIYLDAFEQISTPSGEISPTCVNKLNQKIEKGALIVNYTGHGNETKLTKEGILTNAAIKRLKNINNLPLVMTATCEFGRYDNPLLKSGAEEFLFNPNGGAIALLTTTRPVYSSSNLKVNKALYRAVFDGQRPLGAVMKDTKNKSTYFTNNRNFTLLGDPSMTLAYPKQTIILDTIISEKDTAYFQGDSLWLVNNQVLSTEDTTNFALKALGLVTLKGQVVNNENFSGVVDILVYDKESKIRTLGNEGTKYTFYSRENILYEGKATVNKGRFSSTFIVPKDISYQLGFGKISMYAKDSINELLDAAGGEQSISIGGTASNIQADNTPPKIRLHMDNFNFKNGETVSSSPVLLANLFDESGINLSSAGLGHEIVATLDGDDASSLILNSFYTSNVDDYTNGVVQFPYKDLEEGEHTLTLRVWDTHNNVNEATIKFVVDYTLATVYSYPNPMTDQATFVVEHSREGIDVDVIIDIISPDGKNAYHFEKKIKNSPLIIDEITWNGENDYNTKLTTGVYFCRVTLRYADGSTVLAKVHRLVLID